MKIGELNTAMKINFTLFELLSNLLQARALSVHKLLLLIQKERVFDPIPAYLYIGTHALRNGSLLRQTNQFMQKRSRFVFTSNYWNLPDGKSIKLKTYSQHTRLKA